MSEAGQKQRKKLSDILHEGHEQRPNASERSREANALLRIAEAIEMTWPHNEESEKASVELAHYLYEDKIGAAFLKCFRTPNRDNASADTVNVVDGMFAIAEAISNLGDVVDRLRAEPEKTRKVKS